VKPRQVSVDFGFVLEHVESQDVAGAFKEEGKVFGILLE
jgi:hypothetical protein